MEISTFINKMERDYPMVAMSRVLKRIGKEIMFWEAEGRGDMENYISKAWSREKSPSQPTVENREGRDQATVNTKKRLLVRHSSTRSVQN